MPRMPRPFLLALVLGTVCLVPLASAQGKRPGDKPPAPKPGDEKPGDGSPAADKPVEDVAAFEDRVNKAIDAGVAHLKGRQRDDGSWAEARQGFEPGSDALCLLALASSGLHPDDPVMVRGFDALLKAPFKKVYTVAVTIMALEAAFCSLDKKKQYTSKSIGSFSAADSAQSSKKIQVRMAEAIEWLLKQYNQQHKGWRYPSDNIDHSHIQYVLLAFKAACRCGLGHLIPNDIWLDVMKAMLPRQQRTGPLVKKLGERKIEKSRDGSVEIRDWYGSVEQTPARGWGYDPFVPNEVVTGSMTTAGVAIILICRSELIRRKDPRYTKALHQETQASIEGGAAWIAHNFAVEQNPGYPPPRDPENPPERWHFYYLYGLERAGVFLDTEKFGDHDWYREGATFLLKKQDEQGGWQDEEHTCYALLFLKRATRPLEITK